MRESDDQRQSLLHGYIDLLRASWRLIAVVAFVIVGLSLAYSLTRPKQYEATANILFRKTTIGQQVAGVPIFEDPQTPSSAGAEMTTNVNLLNQESIATSVIRRLNLRMTEDELKTHVTIEQIGLSNLASVTVRANSPAQAERLANAWSDAFIDIRQSVDRAKIGDGLKLIQDRLNQSPAASENSAVTRALRTQSQKLELLETVQDGNAEIVQSASRPTQEAAPRPKRSAVLALVFGLLLGVAVAALRRAIDRRVKTAAEVEELIGFPVLSEVNDSVFGKDSAILADQADARQAEQFRTLMVNLRFMDLSAERRVLLITSATPQEGKTTVAGNLAMTLARSGRKVSLVDADLRRPALHRMFGVPLEPGVTSVVAGYRAVDAAWTRLPSPTGAGEDGARLITGGNTPPNPLDLLASEQMRDLLAQARDESDYVIVDSPPVLLVSDAVPLAAHVDGVLLVVRLHRTTRDAVRRLGETMRRAGLRPLGVIVTGGAQAKRYGTYGEYYTRQEPEQKALSVS